MNLFIFAPQEREKGACLQHHEEALIVNRKL